jgi:UDP-N-acetylglucosamine:LPS N-acetylglucosamine transferase
MRILKSAAMGNSVVVKAIERIKEDERKTSAVFLFDDYITPDSFCKHWEALGVKIVPIRGVFGGKRLVSREEARKRMGISESPNDKTVYILGGGTPVWDAKLPEIIAQLKEKVLPYDVVVFDRNAKPNDYQRVGNSLYKGGAVYGETVQGLLPGVDLIITRAGGGIANDAIACRVPFVCVEEPGHWQVEMIRKNCERRRLTRTIPIDQFRRGDIAELISDQLIRHEANNTQQASNREIREKMKDIDNGKEDAVAEQIVEWCHSAQEYGRSG